MPVWEKIRRRALTAVDEVYPAEDNENAAFFPVDEYLVEAGRWIARTVPSYALGSGKPIPTDGLDARADGSGSLPLPSDFLRLLRFRMKGWMRPVTAAMTDADARYVQQANRTLRGGEARPVAAIVEGGTRLEYYSSSLGKQARVVEARYFGISSTEDAYPDNLIEITAWKTAELVLTSISDAGAAQQCAAKVNEHLQVL